MEVGKRLKALGLQDWEPSKMAILYQNFFLQNSYVILTYLPRKHTVR